MVGSAIRAGSGDAVVSAAGDVVLSTATDSDSRTETSNRSGRLTGRSREHTLATTTAVGSTVTAGRDIRLISSGGDVTLQMARAEAGRDLTLSATTGTVSLLTGKDTRFEQSKSSSNNGVWQKSRDQGSTGETLHATRLSAGDDLTITAGKGVVVEVETRGDLRASLEAMVSQPGMAWVAQLRGREDVNWRLVQAHYDSWDHKSQGLTGPAAALIALAVTIATSGTGAGAAGLIGIGAENAALAAGIDAAASAAISSLASTATVSLINNRGNIGAVLKEMGSSANVRSLLVAMGSAGITSGITQTAGFQDLRPAGAALQDRALRSALDQMTRAGVGTVMDTTLGGRSLEKALVANLRTAAAGTIGEIAANEIGSAYHDAAINGRDPLEYALHKVAHAALGCGTAALGGASCAAGAVGGATSAVVSEAFYDPSKKALELSALVNDGSLNADQALATLLDWQTQGVDLSKLAGGFAALIAGAKSAEDVHAGANAGENMSKNNWLESAWDLFSLALSIQEFGFALTNDDASTLDAVAAGSALAFDVGALIVPGLPGGAGATLHIVREGEGPALKVIGENGEDLTDTVKMAVQEQKATGGTARPRVSVETKGTPESYFGQQRRYWTDDPVHFNGNRVYQRNDQFDPGQVSTWRENGQFVQGTNLERMASGRAPIGNDGRPINLHHMTQTQGGAIAEVTQTFHQQNFGTIHINTGSLPSGINRAEFDAWRADYWQNRAGTWGQ